MPAHWLHVKMPLEEMFTHFMKDRAFALELQAYLRQTDCVDSRIMDYAR